MDVHRSASEEISVRRPSGAAVMRVELTDALTRAFFEEWARVGYAALSLERVARNAGAGKAALYRRWSSKAEMASDLLSQVGLTLTETEDMGSLEADLLTQLKAIRRVLRHPQIKRIIADLHAEIGREPALDASVMPFVRARRKRTEQLIERAVARGELSPDVDRETIADLLAAPLYWRMVVMRGRSDLDHIERLARMTAAAMSAAW